VIKGDVMSLGFPFIKYLGNTNIRDQLCVSPYYVLRLLFDKFFNAKKKRGKCLKAWGLTY
jgi:hypothetical protein